LQPVPLTEELRDHMLLYAFDPSSVLAGVPDTGRP
jgi:hypothetical protein